MNRPEPVIGKTGPAEVEELAMVLHAAAHVSEIASPTPSFTSAFRGRYCQMPKSQCLAIYRAEAIILLAAGYSLVRTGADKGR
jgi:hypothetical protein